MTPTDVPAYDYDFDKKVKTYSRYSIILRIIISIVLFVMQSLAIYSFVTYFIPYIVSAYISGFTFLNSMWVALILSGLASSLGLNIMTYNGVLGKISEETFINSLEKSGNKYIDAYREAKVHVVFSDIIKSLFHIVNMIPIFLTVLL